MAGVDNGLLLEAGLELMRRNGKPLTRRGVRGMGRAMLYVLSDGGTVRARTCNDHILITVADSPNEDAALNIEGTDWLLIAMPEVERTPGKVMVYLVPVPVAVEAVRERHGRWLASNPTTEGRNTTWNLLFDDAITRKWAAYRLSGEITTQEIEVALDGRGKLSASVPPGSDAVTPPTAGSTGGNGFRAEVEAARRHLAALAGVSPEAVKITIDFV